MQHDLINPPLDPPHTDEWHNYLTGVATIHSAIEAYRQACLTYERMVGEHFDRGQVLRDIRHAAESLREIAGEFE